MASTIKATESGTIRVNIGKKDLARWVGEDVPQSLVQHWIELGRQRQDIEDNADKKHQDLMHNLKDLRTEIDELRDDNRRLALLVSQVSHLLCVSSTTSHLELEELRFKSDKGASLNPSEKSKLNLFKVKDFNFRRYLSMIFPGVESDRFLSLEQRMD